jgi:hypothetical protein
MSDQDETQDGRLYYLGTSTPVVVPLPGDKREPWRVERAPLPDERLAELRKLASAEMQDAVWEIDRLREIEQAGVRGRYVDNPAHSPRRLRETWQQASQHRERRVGDG